jgi:hypothetical protein
LFQDKFELKTIALWDVESGACLLLPLVTWTNDDVEVKLSSGVFLGSDEGLFGQFHDNSFAKLGITYTF